MKKLHLIIILLAATLGCYADGNKQIVILHTNDTHSQIMPFNKNLRDEVKADRAGYLRRANLVEEERKADKKLLLLDSGDFSQGSSYYTVFKGDVEVGLMNIMKYDAATIGNHEFDYGLDNMARLFKMAKFPIVCANYDFTGTVCEKVVKPYVVLKRKGVKIGIFGLSPKLQGLVVNKNWEGITYLDPYKTAEKMSRILREEEKCDIVICLSHLGYKNDDPTQSDEILAEKTSGIDLILGGHTHSYLEKPVEVKNKEGKTVLIDQNGKSGIFLSRLAIELEEK